jgi:hypothetical protein
VGGASSPSSYWRRVERRPNRRVGLMVVRRRPNRKSRTLRFAAFPPSNLRHWSW